MKRMQLTGKQKVALMLHRAGYSDAKIAAELGISRENANRLIGRAKKQLREFLNDVALFVDTGDIDDFLARRKQTTSPRGKFGEIESSAGRRIGQLSS